MAWEILRDKFAQALSFPLPAKLAESSGAAWVKQSTVLTIRQLMVWIRDPATMLQSIIVPVLSMLMFKVTLGETVTTTTSQNSAYGTVPLVILIGAMFGSMAGAVRLNEERKTGLLTRLYVMPIHRVADLTSRIMAELLRILITTLILLAVGHLIGFRFTQGFLASAAVPGIALMYGIAFSTMVLAFAVSTTNVPLVPLLSLLASVLMFFNSGFAPLDSFPGWLQPIVANQPMSCAIEAMRGLSIGGAVAVPLLKTVFWAGLLVTLFLRPAIRGYQTAAASRD